MCDDLSNYLQKKNFQSEDISMIINMIKYLLQNAKIKLLQNLSSTMISLCDTYLSLIDILEQLLLANVSNLPSLYDLRNPESVRRVRNRLLEEERYELAMNLSTKFGLDTQSVWASWGLVELRRANYKEARNKFDKCLKQVNEKSQATSISSAQIKILNDILTHLESVLPNRMIGVIRSFFQYLFYNILINLRILNSRRDYWLN
jgi:zinc finger FYVE domain-containing protein 26